MFTLTAVIETIAVALACALLYGLCLRTALGALQQAGYDGKTYRAWLRRRGNMLLSRFGLLALLTALTMLVLGFCFTFAEGWAAYIALVPVPLFVGLFCYADRRALKVPLESTPRVRRICAINAALPFVLSFALVLAGGAVAHWTRPEFVDNLRYLPLALVPLLAPHALSLANRLEKPVSSKKNGRYLAAAREKLRGAPCIRIGVTGSFGKTSVKSFLAALLEPRFRVLATPSSFNTPLGIARTVEGADFSQCDVFIAEMGARRSGDIAELCELVRPDHCVLTGVGPQHVQTFGSVEAVVSAKAEILAGTKRGGFAVVGQDENTARLDVAAAGLVPVPVGEGCAFGAKEICCTASGTDFVLVLDGEEVPVHTKLLGAHNAFDIALAAAMAYRLGLSAEEIARGVGRIGYVPHRLQPVAAGGVTVLDDSYNSNVRGAAEALRVLRLFGGRKFVVTPGLVELGVLEREENEALGAQLCGLDCVVLVGETLVLAVKEGYLAAGGDAGKLFVAPTLEKAKDLLAERLQDGDAVLFLNDLPDIYG